jgi:hypothetical protein
MTMWPDRPGSGTGPGDRSLNGNAVTVNEAAEVHPTLALIAGRLAAGGGPGAHGDGPSQAEPDGDHAHRAGQHTDARLAVRKAWMP